MKDWRDDLLDMIESGLRSIGASDDPATAVRMRVDQLRHGIEQCRARPDMVASFKDAAERDAVSAEEVIAYIKANPHKIGAALAENNALYRSLSRQV